MIERMTLAHPDWRIVPVEDVIYVFNAEGQLIFMMPNWDWDRE